MYPLTPELKPISADALDLLVLDQLPGVGTSSALRLVIGGVEGLGGAPVSPPLSGPESLVWAALAEDTLVIDVLDHRAGLPVGTALAVLTTQELHGDVERMSGMRFRRAA